ncbi:MAG TPA: Rieske (2Fe-2S) protein [Nitrososphaeraceae archaeon]|nr:Rieske (2Fe-2S) protein [Nitrososphaeraceae archaeon]
MEYMVCKSDELPNNSIKVISVRDSKILVCRSNNQLFAFDNSCPHRGASLSKSEIKGTKIVCYMHDFEYDLNNGKLIHIPSKWNEQNPNLTKSDNLLLFQISEKNGQIYLHI